MRIYWYFICWLLIISCQYENRPKNITIATAANAQFVMEVLSNTFTKTTGITCQMTISSSGKLTTQIQEGAPFDVFVSADTKYPEALYRQGKSKNPLEIYAYGKLVFWTLLDSNLLDINTLSTNAIKHIAIPNPETAPYGVAALESLAYFQLKDKVASKLVFGESISQTNQFVLTKAAEIGITAKSIVTAPQMEGIGYWKDIEPNSYKPIAQSFIVMKENEATAAFKYFMLSPVAQQILEQYGYEVIRK